MSHKNTVIHVTNDVAKCLHYGGHQQLQRKQATTRGIQGATLSHQNLDSVTYIANSDRGIIHPHIKESFLYDYIEMD